MGGSGVAHGLVGTICTRTCPGTASRAGRGNPPVPTHGYLKVLGEARQQGRPCRLIASTIFHNPAYTARAPLA